MSQAPGKFARMLPGIALLRSYELTWLAPDLVAGLTLAAYLLPAAIADASLAQLPPQAGIYACLFSGLVFWLFCSSRHTAITITSAISLLIGATLGEMGNGEALERARAKIVAVEDPPERPRLRWRDLQGALGVFLLVGFNADDPGLPMVLFLLVVCGAVLGLLMVVMRALLRQATTLRTDMESVI